MCARIQQLKRFSRAVTFTWSLMVFIGISGAQPAMDWWIEVVAERSLPEAVQESRRKAAEKKTEKDDKDPKKEDEEITD